MTGEIEQVSEALNRARVRYLVVGGVAVALHGYLRTTADLDLVVQLSRAPRPLMTKDESANRRDGSSGVPDDGFDHGYEGHFRRQVRLGLGLSYAKRLQRLERTMDELRRIVSRARRRS